MPTFSHPVRNNTIHIGVSVAVADAPASAHRFDALVDTGAQGTMVSDRVVARTNARPVGRSAYLPASGIPVATNLYAVHMWIPVDIPDDPYNFGGPLAVRELSYQPEGYDVILGMDMLCRCHITMHGGRFVMSV